MLRRAKRLQSVLNNYCTKFRHPYLMLDPDEWRQIEYLLWITQPFFKFTTVLSKTKDVTVHSVFEIYNDLFDHLDDSIAQLRRKRVHWKQLMLTALEASKAKLISYYKKTEGMRGDLFAIGAILAPDQKLAFFSTSDWEGGWRERYHQSIQDYFKPYQDRLSNNRASQSSPSSLSGQTSDLKKVLKRKNRGLSKSNPTLSQRDELTRYLESGMFHSIFE